MSNIFLFKWESCSRFFNWSLLFPVCETVGCTCPFNQRSTESRCAIVSEMLSWLKYFPYEEVVPHLTPPTPIFICMWMDTLANKWPLKTRAMTQTGMLRFAKTREIKNNRGVANPPPPSTPPIYVTVSLGLCVDIILEIPYTRILESIAVICLVTK